MSGLVRYEARKAPTRRLTEQQLRQEIIQVCRLLHQQGYCLGYDGNVSARQLLNAEPNGPVRAVIVGIVDAIDLPETGL